MTIDKIDQVNMKTSNSDFSQFENIEMTSGFKTNISNTSQLIHQTASKLMFGVLKKDQNYK